MRGTTAVAAAVALLQTRCAAIYISANRDLERLSDLPGTLVRDRRESYAGPLAGLEALAVQPLRSQLLLLPCDMPLLQEAVLSKLQQALLADDALDLAYACADGREHYLCAALRRRALDGLPAALDRGQRSVRSWLGTLCTRGVAVDPPLAAGLRNFNRLEEWETLEPDSD